MMAQVSEWVSLADLPDEAAASAIVSREPHVLIDLNGLSKGNRPGILLRRPAPLILSFLGYPATSGGTAQMVVGDGVAAPPELSSLFTERLLLLPGSYFLSDHPALYPRPQGTADESEALRCRGGEERTPAGGRCVALPGQGEVVLANFGQMYKIQPDLLDAWCRALATNEKGVLWLLRFPESAVAGIEREFSARCSSKGVNASRLVLSTLLPAEEHIVAKGLADFALDTLPFNGHTTGADTLWAGVPLISLPGDRMCGRAGASMARGVGETAFLARDLSDYQALVERVLAGGGGVWRARERLRERVWGAATANGGVFDTLGWTRGWERALALAWDLLAAATAREKAASAREAVGRGGGKSGAKAKGRGRRRAAWEVSHLVVARPLPPGAP